MLVDFLYNRYFTSMLKLHDKVRQRINFFCLHATLAAHLNILNFCREQGVANFI